MSKSLEIILLRALSWYIRIHIYSDNLSMRMNDEAMDIINDITVAIANVSRET